MSGSKPTVAIRITADGADQARRQIEAIGPAGEAAMRRVAVASAAAAPEMQRLATASDVANRAFVGMGGSLGRVGASFSGVASVASGLTAGFVALGAAAALGAVQIAKAGDTATATLARLSSATGGLGQAQAVYERLFALSQQTGVAVAESAGAFARFSVAAKEIGGTTDQVLKLVSGIQKAGIVAGASAQETGAAVQQIGQALASGTLQGDELRSLLENMPQLAQALARELGVSIGQLRQMGSEGQLTADKVFPALLRASERMGEEFAKMPVTMGRAKDILLEATDNFGARLDRITGLSQTFAKFMQQGAAALNAAGRYVAPNEREAAEDNVAAAERRLARLRSQGVTPQPPPSVNILPGGLSLPRGPDLSRWSDRPSSISNEPPGASIRRFFSSGDPRPPQDPFGVSLSPAGVVPDRNAELAEAEAALLEANRRLAAIRRDDREMQRAEAEDAAAKAREASQSAATLRLKDTAADLDARYKARQAYQDRIKKLDEDEAKGGTLPAGVTFDGLRKQAAEDLAEALAKVAKEEGRAGDEARKSAEELAKAAEKRQDVIDTLQLQVRAAEEELASTLAGTSASREFAIALEIENRIRAAGIPDIGKRTDAQKRDAEQIAVNVRKLDDLKKANKEAEEAAKRAREFSERSWNAVADIGERAFDRLGDAIVQAFVNGQGAAVNFGNVAKAILSSVVADFAKLAVVNPILNSLFTSSSGARPTLSAALGGGGGLGDLLGLSSLIPKDGLLGSLGLSGAGAGLSASIFGTSGVSAGTASLFMDATGVAASAVPGTAGLLGTYGTSLMGGSALSLGGAFGSVGGGLAISSLLNSALGRSSEQSRNGMIGSGLGGLAGFLIGGPLGGLIGGTLGGLGGGLIGPGESVRGYGLRFQSNAYNEAVGGTNDYGTALKPIDYTFYNEEGKAAFQAAEQQVAATNAYLSSRNLRVAGASVIGGNKNGPDYSWADAGTLGEGFSRLRFSAMDNANLDEQLRQRNFTGVEGLQQYVEAFIGIQDTIKALTTDAIPAFDAQLKAINDNFDNLSKQAKEYGVAETGLAEARAKSIAALEAERAETLRQSDVSLSIRRLAAGGNTMEAELARQTEAARQELDAFGKSLDALALTAADKAARLVNLEEVQAAERAAIIQRYGEQAAQALRQAGGTIRQYLDSLATGTAAGASPTDRLAAAQANFERDRILATGGDRDALGRITSSADALLGAGRDVFASGGGFQAILQQVTGGLSALPVVQSYDAQQTAALQAIQQALTTGTLNTATVILPAGNVVQLAGGLASPDMLARLDALIGATGNVTGTLVAGFGILTGTLVSGLGTVAGTTGTGLASLNQSLATIHAATADLNTSLATIHGSVVNGAGALAGGLDIVARAGAAANDNILAVGAALQAGQVVANGLLAAVPVQVLASGTATLNGLASLNQSLAIIHAATADLNASLGTIHASIVVGLGVLAAGLDITAQQAAATNSSVIAAGAALQQGQAVGNTGLAILAGGLAVIDATARDVNASLGAVHGSIVDVNSSLSTVHSAIVNGLGVVAAGQDITARAVVAAGAALQSGQAVANTIEVGNANAFAAYYGVMTTYLAQIAANTASAPLPAPGFTYGGGIGGGNGGVDNILTTYTPQVLNGGTRPTQSASLGVTAAGPGVVGELQALRQEVASLRGTMQQVGIVVAQETRAGNAAVVGALDEQTTVIKRAAA